MDALRHVPERKEAALDEDRFSQISSGTDLLSHPRWKAVPSALAGLTSGFGMGPGVTPPLWAPKQYSVVLIGLGTHFSLRTNNERRHLQPSPRPISTGQLNALLRFHLRPINPVFWLGALPGYPVGNLILESASHLDAFSAYPFRT